MYLYFLCCSQSLLPLFNLKLYFYWVCFVSLSFQPRLREHSSAPQQTLCRAGPKNIQVGFNAVLETIQRRMIYVIVKKLWWKTDFESRRIDHSDVGTVCLSKEVASAKTFVMNNQWSDLNSIWGKPERGHLGFGAKSVSDGKGNLLPVLLLSQVCQVVIPEQAVCNAALTHPLLTKHHKPDVHRLKGRMVF